MTGDLRFTGVGRHLGEEDRIQLTSVGVDIGSSTSHLVFSRLELERADNRYVTVNRTVLYESEILLTPYVDGTTIDGKALKGFIDRQYAAAGIRRQQVDTGALILTGVALFRQNARAIGELFAEEAGRFVAVSAGDNLEATIAAYGSGAIALSGRGRQSVMNVDIGGGTTKIAICSEGSVRDTAVLDVGARLVAWDENGIVTRLEQAGRHIGQVVGLDLYPGARITIEDSRAMAAYMADRLLEAVGQAPLTDATAGLMRTGPLTMTSPVHGVIFSGGVAEFIYAREASQFGDLGHLLAQEITARMAPTGLQVLQAAVGIRATVIGASQYTVQVSGSTVFLSALDVVPLRDVPVVAPRLSLGMDEIDPAVVRGAVRDALGRCDLFSTETPVALALRWGGTASYARIDRFCHGIVEGLHDVLVAGHPIVLVFDGDVGGLFGIHLKEEMNLPNAVVSIDGIELKEFDYVDIGSLIPSSGAVPVVIKSLVFPDVPARHVVG